jgi:hypothetical protein
MASGHRLTLNHTPGILPDARPEKEITAMPGVKPGSRKK